jgi:hypothetical protein
MLGLKREARLRAEVPGIDVYARAAENDGVGLRHLERRRVLRFVPAMPDLTL